jgi:hypothetical protein
MWENDADVVVEIKAFLFRTHKSQVDCISVFFFFGVRKW